MNFLDITLAQIMFGIGAGIMVFGGVCSVMWLVNKIINWAWWKKENRQYLKDWWYFLDHKNEILEYIKNSKQKRE